MFKKNEFIKDFAEGSCNLCGRFNNVHHIKAVGGPLSRICDPCEIALGKWTQLWYETNNMNYIMHKGEIEQYIARHNASVIYHQEQMGAKCYRCQKKIESEIPIRICPHCDSSQFIEGMYQPPIPRTREPKKIRKPKHESVVYVKYLEREVIGYETWDQEGWLDATVTSREIMTNGIPIREVVSVHCQMFGGGKDHYFRGMCSAHELQKLVEKLGYAVLWKGEGNGSDNKRNTNGWLIHWKIDWKDVLNPDGWDRKNLEASMDKLISLEEFELRLASSTCQETLKIKDFFDRRKNHRHTLVKLQKKNHEDEELYNMIRKEQHSPYPWL